MLHQSHLPILTFKQFMNVRLAVTEKKENKSKTLFLLIENIIFYNNLLNNVRIFYSKSNLDMIFDQVTQK